MTKKKVSLDIFEESVLETLKAKHTDAQGALDAKALQKSIDDGYSIYEEDAEGKSTSIKYTVSAPKTEPATKGRTDGNDDDRIIGLITKTVADSMAASTKSIVDAIKAPPTIVVHDRPWLNGGLKMYKPIKSFTGTELERKEKAYRFGAWMLGSVFGMKKYADWCHKEGITTEKAADDKATIVLKAQSEGTNTAGGYLVPDVLENDLIQLRETYGVFRANARLRPMTRDTAAIARRASGLTAYFPAEGGSITESQKGWDNVNLSAKKLAALAKYSSEVLEDAIISIADDLADEIVYAFSLKEDQCGFVGDGTSTYGGIVGVTRALTTNWTSTSTSSAGVIVSAGNLISEIADGDCVGAMGILPEFADDGTAAWYCSRYVAYNVFGRLLRAAGGVTISESAGAVPQNYGGYPIKITQVMPKTDTNSQIVAFFGSLRKAADFGDRRQTTISVSDQRYWENDQVGIRGTERFDIVVHDVGDGTNGGPIVGIRAAAS